MRLIAGVHEAVERTPWEHAESTRLAPEVPCGEPDGVELRLARATVAALGTGELKKT
jgi:hypothetical protein